MEMHSKSSGLHIPFVEIKILREEMQSLQNLFVLVFSNCFYAPLLYWSGVHFRLSGMELLAGICGTLSLITGMEVVSADVPPEGCIWWLYNAAHMRCLSPSYYAWIPKISQNQSWSYLTIQKQF